MELRFFWIKSTLLLHFSTDFTESFLYSRVYDLGRVPKQVLSPCYLESLSQQSRITQQVGITVLAGHVLKNCTRYLIIRLFRMFKKSSVDLNGPPQRSQVCIFFIFTAAKM